MNIKEKLAKIPGFLAKNILIGLRPLLGPDARCKYTITCTPYAIHEFETKPFLSALISATKRVLSCFSLF